MQIVKKKNPGITSTAHLAIQISFSKFNKIKLSFNDIITNKKILILFFLLLLLQTMNMNRAMN